MAELIGRIATFFRASGMLCDNADWVKYLVSIGNLFWLTNGIMTKNRPLIASNAICLLAIIYELINKMV